MATLIARPLTRVRDPMAGYFAISRATLSAARPLNPIGYKILLELIVKCNCQSVIEVPIEFRDRQHGQSKLSLREQVNYVRHVARLIRNRCGFAAAVRLWDATSTELHQWRRDSA
jgi:dolichol-phosphate mannosyltransferase